MQVLGLAHVYREAALVQYGVVQMIGWRALIYDDAANIYSQPAIIQYEQAQIMRGTAQVFESLIIVFERLLQQFLSRLEFDYGVFKQRAVWL